MLDDKVTKCIKAEQKKVSKMRMRSVIKPTSHKQDYPATVEESAPKTKRATIDYSFDRTMRMAHQSLFLDIKWLVLLSWFIACVWSLSIPKTNCILNSELEECFSFFGACGSSGLRWKLVLWRSSWVLCFTVPFALMVFYGRSSRLQILILTQYLLP